ncbi:MAG TPA: SpoIIE family protein phosphatase [Phycisphaerae bacterium]|nr:SpoIIE family protein phosphatase [Phycisphaerae bacterium]
MAQPHIQVILAADSVPESLRAALQRTSATASFWALSEALRGDPTLMADAVVIVLPQDATALAGPLRVLLDRLAERPRATLLLTPSNPALPPLDHPPTLPVTFGSGLDEHDLTACLTTMLAMRNSLDSLHRGLLANRRSGESVALRYMSQLRLASQVQREFLPETLPRFGPLSFDVVFRPVDYVSGDIYDVRRLDENHVGIALADASGHGIPAALLTVYIKRALRGKEVDNGSYRLLAPDEVLSALNEDILEAGLSECPFVAAIYAVLNIRTLEMALARGGAPYPLYRTADGAVHLIESPGGVVGVLPHARFEVRTVQLQPGECVLFCTDGLERVVAPQHTVRNVPAGLQRAADQMAASRSLAADADGADGGGVALATLAEPDVGTPTDEAAAARHTLTRAADTPCERNLVLDSPWCDVLRDQGPSAALEQVAGRQRALRRMGYPLDDLTVLAIRVDAD